MIARYIAVNRWSQYTLRLYVSPYTDIYGHTCDYGVSSSRPFFLPFDAFTEFYTLTLSKQSQTENPCVYLHLKCIPPYVHSIDRHIAKCNYWTGLRDSIIYREHMRWCDTVMHRKGKRELLLDRKGFHHWRYIPFIVDSVSKDEYVLDPTWISYEFLFSIVHSSIGYYIFWVVWWICLVFRLS